MAGHKPHSLEYTAILGNNTVFHYTCNAPELEILKKHHIQAIGDEYGCIDAREVLIIPHSVYEAYGLPVRKEDIKLQSENLLRKLD
jgi:hypothetical protein